MVPPGLKAGKCHVCKDEKALIRLCAWCGHWICGVCRNDWPARMAAAFASFKAGPTPGCCGPRP